MSSPSSATDHGHATPAACENCETPLHGHFCHACGQSVHSPVRNFGHAVEEVFESFWHLDGRIFRTLRGLLSPGRVAIGYLAGHRARYVAPLRLFVIVTVLTFFVGQSVIHFDSPIKPTVELDDGGDGSSIETARTQAEVDTRLEEGLNTLTQARTAMEVTPVTAARTAGMKALDVSAAALREQARRRSQALQAAGKAASTGDTRASNAIPASKPAPAVPGAASKPPGDDVAATDTGPKAGAGTTAADGKNKDDVMGEVFSQGVNPWHETRNPLRVEWLPAFGNRWLNRQIGRAQRNIPRFKQDPELFKNAMIGAIPSALFVLVPVFALLLKLGYITTGRVYLEHLVVALYSHAYLCLAVLVMFLLMALMAWLETHWSPGVVLVGFAEFFLWCWMPTYLLLMQKRVYGQGWLLTLTKFLTLGFLYFLLMTLAMLFVIIAGVVRA
ncbi:DUF3667 domain-containing protein [Montanilutibacter psychrotolerans]|uniref:DUF3667 domain-containing protein n=1 Tax=Montanilutibacter psychrotolerans TaxID=1327343 RepID=UPI001680AE6D|nr:DUF3667 domain-containing protein [Lysobacter psychrotolerans]